MPEPSSDKGRKKRKTVDLVEGDSHTNKGGHEPLPVTESTSDGGGIDVERPAVPDWETLLDSLGPLIDERKKLFKRLADIDRLIKEAMRQGCQC